MLSPPSPRWLPSKGEPYFLILGHGQVAIFRWNDTDFDQEAWHFGNVFVSLEQAEHARDTIKEVLHALHEG